MTVLMSGTAIAQGLTIAAAPILTRLYGPETFGLLGLYTSIIGIVTVVMTLRYELAVVLPRDDKGSANVLVLSISIALLLTIALSLLIVFFNYEIAQILNTPELQQWLWLVPIGAFSLGTYNALKYWSTRKKQFQRLSISQVIRSTGQVSTQVSGGLLSMGPSGLLGGQVLGQIIATVTLGYQVIKEDLKIITSSLSIKHMSIIAKKYKDFPLFSSSQALVNSVSQHATPFILAAFFGPAIVGFYTLALKLIQMPANLVGEAFKQVYYQKASELTNNNKPLDTHMLKSSFYLAIIGFIPALVIFIFAPQIFYFALGEDWYVAGQYSRWLIFWMYFWFVNRPAVSSIQVFGWQKYLLIYESVLLLARVIAISLSAIYYDALTAVAAFSVLGAVFTPIVTISTYVALKKKGNQRVKDG